MFTVALVMISRKWNQTKSPSADTLVTENEMYLQRYTTQLQKNESVTCACKCGQLEIMSDVTWQQKTNTACSPPYPVPSFMLYLLCVQLRLLTESRKSRYCSEAGSEGG